MRLRARVAARSERERESEGSVPPVPLPHPQAHEYLLAIAESITGGEVNALAASLLSYMSHYRREAQVRALGMCVCVFVQWH